METCSKVHGGSKEVAVWWILDAFGEVTRGSENMVVGSAQVQLAARVVDAGRCMEDMGAQGGSK